MADDHPAAIQRAAIATKDAAIATSTATYTPARVTTSSPPTLAAASSVPITAPFASLPNRRPGTWYSPAHAVVLARKRTTEPFGATLSSQEPLHPSALPRTNLQGTDFSTLRDPSTRSPRRTSPKSPSSATDTSAFS